jgi:hypothetical protein
LVNDELMAAEGHVLETSDLDEDELVEGDESLDEEDLVAELRAFLDDFGGDESP